MGSPAKFPSLGPYCFYFGTFNPIHTGHLILAQAALCQFDFERVVFIPAGHPPHRHQEAGLLSATIRAELVELAIADNPRFAIDRVELEDDCPSYTVNTVAHLRSSGRYGELSTPIPLLIGSDALLHLATWHRPAELIDLACFLQIRRPGNAFVETLTLPLADSEKKGATRTFEKRPLNTILLEAPLLEISATALRQQIKTAKGQARQTLEDLRYSLPEPVRQRLAKAEYLF
jgi:nicotinate-nucleotide adenylyltransferase